MALVRLANEHAGELNLICIAPATNLAVAYKLDSSLPSKISSICMMGGTSRALGNLTLSTEYNFRQDPEAIAIVMREFKNITIIPWETCLEAEPTKEEHIEALYGHKTTLGIFHKQSNDFYIKIGIKRLLVDTLTALVIIDPSIATKKFKACGVIETTNGMSKGEISYFYPGDTSCDQHYQVTLMKNKYDIDCSQANCEVVTGIDLEKCVKIVSDAITELGKWENETT